MLEVSRSGYYAWAARGPSTRAVADVLMTERIREIHCESDGSYGSRRVHAQLRREGVEVNKKRVERLMRVGEIVGAHVPARRRRSDASGLLGIEGVKAWPDLVGRDFAPQAPDQLWCADMKQIPTGEGVLHLASVLDCFSRRVVGWRMAGVADELLVASAVRAAVAQRRPGQGLIHHSDRGCQYTAVTFAKGLVASGIVASFSAKGTPYDNSVKESFFATFEKEHLRSRTFETHAQARASIFRYIEGWYNPRRLHSTLGYRSPDEAERDYHDQPVIAASVTTERAA
jgi:putative transposase